MNTQNRKHFTTISGRFMRWDVNGRRMKRNPEIHQVFNEKKNVCVCLRKAKHH